MATGINISKANAYTVLTPPAGVDISKANVYTVLAPPTGVVISKAVVYVVLDAAVAPSWPSFSFGSGVSGFAYNQTFSANGSGPITYTVASGALPDGLVLTGAEISGIPVVAGQFPFTLRAANAYGAAEQAFSITIVEGQGGGETCLVFLG